jgi:hypothetical protein
MYPRVELDFPEVGVAELWLSIPMLSAPSVPRVHALLKKDFTSYRYVRLI